MEHKLLTLSEHLSSPPEEKTRKCLRQVEHIVVIKPTCFDPPFLYEVFNYGRVYELAENDLDIPAMFLQIINNVCRKIITSPINI
jgi:hypothetical protein